MPPEKKKVNEPKWWDRSGGVVGNRRVGSRHEIIRETHRGQNGVYGLPRPEEPPGGSQSVRSSKETG